MSATHPGQLLRQQFMKPLGITASQLAQRIHVPRSRISEILAGHRGISPDTAARLAALFRVDPQIFLTMQAAWDLEHVQQHPPIEPLDTTGFLVGSMGVMPIPDPPVKQAPTTAPFSQELLARLRAKAALSPKMGEREWVAVTYPSGQRALESRPK